VLREHLASNSPQTFIQHPILTHKQHISEEWSVVKFPVTYGIHSTALRLSLGAATDKDEILKYSKLITVIKLSQTF